ncbi:MAG: F0F1-type ATP synthase assembly protein I [Cryomorphaceae bacterium]|jgi:F0F1-type ATP synthase assembly protein I
MNHNNAQIETKSQPSVVLKLAFLQMLGTVVFSLVLYYCFDPREALSALFGGLIAALASAFFAGRLFVSKQDVQAEEMLMRFYISVMLRAIFTLAMMAVCIVVIEVSILPFIIAYLLAAVVINWLVLLIPDPELV